MVSAARRQCGRRHARPRSACACAWHSLCGRQRPMDTSSIDDDDRDGRPIQRIDVRAAAMTVVVAAGTLYGIRAGVSVLAPVLVSVLLAYAAEPLVRALGRCRVPRLIAVLLVSALLVGAIVVAAGF